MPKSSNQLGFIPIILIMVLLLATGVSAAVVYKTVLQPSSNSETTTTNNQSVSSSPVPTPVSSSLPTVNSSPAPSPSTPSTSIVDTSGNLGGIDVITYLRVDKRAYFIDFKATSFTNFASIYYNLNYDTDLTGTARGVEGTFVPAADQIFGIDGGKPYIRRLIVLGTCSGNICNYDPNPRNFRLTVTTTTKDGKKSTKNQILNYY